jgi:hypothetical protein
MSPKTPVRQGDDRASPSPAASAAASIIEGMPQFETYLWALAGPGPSGQP